VEGLKGKIVLAGGLDAENVGQAIRRLKPWGVDACSRLEAEPGKKDRERMRAFIEAARKEYRV
jgi:phosphoribosylanthranilate isomerase